MIHCRLQGVVRWMPRGARRGAGRARTEGGYQLMVASEQCVQHAPEVEGSSKRLVRRASQILTGWPCTRPVFACGSMRYPMVTRASRGLIGLVSRKRHPQVAGAENSTASNSVPRTNDIMFPITPHYPCKSTPRTARERTAVFFPTPFYDVVFSALSLRGARL